MAERGVHVTERDIRWLEWMVRWRFVTGATIVREFTSRGESAPPTVVDRRLRAFVRVGLVEYERVLAETGRLYWLTRAGMRMAGVDGGAVVHPKFSDIRHDLAVLDVAHWLGTERVPSHTLVTEREIRRVETPTPSRIGPAEERYSLVISETGARAYPDLVSVNRDGRAWGHEVEWSRKENRRLVRLMLAYAESETYDGAVYYAGPNVRDTVARAAAEANSISADRYGHRPINVETWPRDEDPR